MLISRAFPSRYLKAEDLPKGKKVRVKIDTVVMEKVGDGEKPVMYFDGKEKGFVLNVTNSSIITEVVGSEDTDEWLGRYILLYSTTTSYQGKPCPCIRVDVPQPVDEEEADPPF